MKTVISLLITACTAAAAGADQKPNVVLVLANGLAYFDEIRCPLKRSFFRNLVLAVVASCCVAMEAEAGEKEPAVIPRPMELKRNEGPGFVLTEKTVIAGGKGRPVQGLQAIAQ